MLAHPTWLVLGLAICNTLGGWIRVEPAELDVPSAVVTVTWEGMPARYGDTVRLLDPESNQTMDSWRLGRLLTFNEGKGSIPVLLVNYRFPYQFGYYSYGNSTPTALSPIVQCLDVPLFGRLAVSPEPGAMLVTWNSQALPASEGYLVRYGTSKERLTLNSTEGTSHTFSRRMFQCVERSDMRERHSRTPAFRLFRNPGYFHAVRLRNLVPGQRYWYTFGFGGEAAHRSSLSSFFVPSSSVRGFAFGDGGIGGHSGAYVGPKSPSPLSHRLYATAVARKLTQAMLREAEEGDTHGSPYSLVLHLGDTAYALGDALHWDVYQAMVAPLATRVPMVFTVGNHDAFYSHGECGVPFSVRLHTPRPWYHAFKHGPVQFVGLSTEDDIRPRSPQYRWLEHQLGSVNRTLTPWLVVFGHKPMYSTNLQFSTQPWVQKMQRLLESPLARYRVDLCLWAHVHYYERTCRVLQRRCDGGGAVDAGMVHIVAGTGGGELRNLPSGRVPAWIRSRHRSHGYVRFQANRTAFHLEFVSERNVTLDKVDLFK